MESNNLKGTLPNSIGNFLYIQILDLNNNFLTGSIPPTIDSLKNITHLSLSYNQFESLPDNCSKLIKLSYLFLNNNSLPGTIPVGLSTIPNLYYCNLGYNQFGGSIPKEFGNCQNLEILYLENNLLSGIIPKELGNAPKLGGLYFSNNKLNGSIPKELGTLPFLSILDISYNQLTGSIPKEIVENAHVLYLYFDHNQLGGTIPNHFPVHNYLTQLYLNQNNLSGTIPRSMGNLRTLEFLSLAHNDFSGPIPDTLKNCTSLIKLQLADNELRGKLPSVLKALPGLDSINIENNHFTFAGLEPLVQHSFASFLYDNQKKITIHQSGNTLYISAGGTLSNNTYKWYNGNTLVATINGDSTYIPTATGTYSVQITNSVCTDLVLQSGNYTFNALLPAQQNITSIQADKASFSVYPNPAHDFVNVYFNNAVGDAVINIYNVNGKKLTAQKINLQNEKKISVDIILLTAGSYLIEIIADNKVAGQIFTKQ